MSSNSGKPWSLRRRLLWQLVLAFGVLLGGLFIALDLLVDRAMFHQLDQVLAARTTSLAQQLQEGDEPRQAVLSAWDIAGHTEFFAIYDAAGRLRMASHNSGDQPLRLPHAERSHEAGNIRLPDGHSGRYRQVILKRGAFAGGHLVLATERESWDQAESEMHGVLWLGLLLSILAAVLLCMLLLRQAFAHMAREAQRLPHDGPPAQSVLPSTPSELHPFVSAAYAALQTSWALTERERRFSRSVAHELRTPVAEINIASERALAQDNKDALRHGLQQVQQAGARMQRSIEALLALVRFESGQERPQTDPLDLAALLRRQAEALACPQLQLRLPLEAWVICDAGMLEGIISNLLQNAIEYGDVQTEVIVQLCDVGAELVLEVRNRASQLSQEALACFGERHWRGQSEGSAQHAGLGLALVYAMAQALGLKVAFALDAGELCARVSGLQRMG
ncbi:MAG: hypothetical protein KUL75_00125 [Sterolibacterium sp.]|nr:hypothetical protein [Sterolibacterium sp.]